MKWVLKYLRDQLITSSFLVFSNIKIKTVAFITLRIRDILLYQLIVLKTSKYIINFQICLLIILNVKRGLLR